MSIVQPSSQAAKPLIELFSDEQFNALTEEQKDEYLRLYREQVAPKFEEWRKPHRIKAAYGGRGAGAKSRSAVSLLIQFAENPQYFGENIRVLCVRNVQKSIKESSWRGLRDALNNLQYKGWTVTKDEIRNDKNGSYFVFNGLNDMTKDDLKSFESFDILFIEEAAPISKESLTTLEATFRKKGSEIWMLFNRDRTRDPCYELYCEHPDPSWSIIECRPGNLDNPWFDETELPEQWDRLRKTDPEKALHVFEGFPRSQRDRAVWWLSQFMETRNREIEAKGAIEIGLDVARFGKDNSVAFARHGLVVTDKQSVHGFDTVDVAGMVWNMANQNREILIKVDPGYNPGVIDLLKRWGAHVIECAFGAQAEDAETYANAAAEMMFTLPVKEMSIPERYMSQNLIEDITERMYGYDAQGRKKLEPKDDATRTDDAERTTGSFKSRHGGRSPDEGDALCLCFYDGLNTRVDDKLAESARRARQAGM